MYYISKLQLLVFIAALVLVFILSSVASAAVESAAAELDRDTRERIWQQEIRQGWYWRAPEFAGLALMILGLLQCFGLLKLLPHGWGVPLVAAGFVALSVSSSLRAWLRGCAYQAAAPGTSAAGKALRAGIIVAAVELALAGGVCWFILAQGLPVASTRNAPSQTSPAPNAAAAAPEKGGAKADPLWVDEAQALKLLDGKDAAYLEALARREDVRSKVVDGVQFYRSDDIKAMKAAGLPSAAELRQENK